MVNTDNVKLVLSTVLLLIGMAKDYKGTLDSVMSLVHGIDYGTTRNRHYNNTGELQTHTPKGIVRWMNFKTFGIPNPPIDTNPRFAQSNRFAFWKKKAFSFLCLIVWF